MEWAPDGKHIAASYLTGDTFPQGNVTHMISNIVIADERIVRDMGRGSLAQWSPDGRQVLYYVSAFETRENFVRLLNLESNTTNDILRWGPDEPRVWAVWLSDNEIAYLQGEPKVLNLETGETYSLVSQEILELMKGEFPIQWIATLPDKHLFALDSGDLFLFEWRDRQAKLIRQVDDTLDYVHLRFSPDGALLAFGAASCRCARVVGVRDEGVNLTMPSQGHIYMPGNWSPDSKVTTFEDGDMGYRATLIFNRDGTGLRDLPSFIVRSPLFSPQGDRVIWRGADERVYVSKVTVK